MKTFAKHTACFIILTVLLSLLSPAASAQNVSLQNAVFRSAQNMLGAVPYPQVGSIGGEWAIIGLARSGYDVPQEYWDNYYATVEDYVESCKGVLHKKRKIY